MKFYEVKTFCTNCAYRAYYNIKVGKIAIKELKKISCTNCETQNISQINDNFFDDMFMQINNPKVKDD